MAATALQEVEAVRQARLAAQEATYQLQQSQGELEVLRQQVAALEAREQQRQCPAPHPQGLRCAGGPGCAAADALQEARLQAADSRYNQQLTELELAKQLDALQALQWQLDCVVAQLGLAAPATAGGGGGTRAGAAVELAAAGTAPSIGAAPGMDEAQHLVQLLVKVEELRHAQTQLSECQRRLAATEAQLAAQRQAQAGRRGHQPGLAVPAPRDRAGSDEGESTACGAEGDGGELGEGGRLLVGELLQENEALRRRLAEAEDSYRSLERDYEVELLIRTDAEETAATCSARSSPARQQRRQAGAQAGALGEGDAAEGGAGGSRRRQGPPVAQPMDVVARQRLELRLREKDAQLGKLRGVVRELEGKLIEAHKRQADLVMRESSWREQEAQDRRMAALEDEKARLEFAATAAQAEAAAARGEAAVQRRAVKRLQEQAAAAAAAQAGGGGGGSAQVAELLQKRVKVLEAQNIRLRLQAKSGKEEEELAAAEAAAAAAQAAASRRAQSRSGAGEAPPAMESSGEGGDVAPPGENDSPNREGGEGAAGGGGGGEGGASVLDIPFARWEADKRLQKKVETLQVKLREKTTALVSAEAGRRRAEEAAEQAAAAAAAAQGALGHARVQLRQAEQRAEPGVMVPVAQCRELLLEVEELQRQYDELARQHAVVQRSSAAEGAGAGGSADAGAGDAAAGHIEQPSPGAAADLRSSLNAGGGSGDGSGWPASRSLSVLRTSSSRAYRPTDYSGCGSPSVAAPPGGESHLGRAAQATQAAGARATADADSLQAQLLKKDVALFDAQLQRDQAAAEVARHRRRLHSLLDCLSPHPQDGEAAAAIAEARQLAGLPPLAGSGGVGGAGGWGAAAGPAAAGKLPGGKPAPGGGMAVGGPGGRRKDPTGREQELLDTIELLKGAVERTKKGLESGVSSAKYMAAVDKAKALKARCAELEAQLEGAAKVREELARVQAALGAAHGTASALRAQLKAGKDARQEAGAAREARLAAQVAERTLRERDAQMEALASTTSQVDEEVRVLAAEGLRPADLIQELLLLRPRARELEARNAELECELAGMEEALARDVAALQADHGLLRRQAERWEGELRSMCARTGEPLPLGLG